MFNEDHVKTGWLFKESKYWKTWRRRFVVLTKFYLMTFESEDTSKTPTEVIIVKYCNAVRSADDDTKKQNSFRLEAEGVVYFLYADSKADKDQWVAALSNLISEIDDPAEHETDQRTVLRFLRRR